MATLNSKRFSHVDDLKAIHPDSLIRFLKPHAAYFAAKGFILPSEGSPDDFDYEALTSLFISTDDMPPHLVEALYQVNEMATPEGMQDLLERCEEAGIELVLGEEPAPKVMPFERDEGLPRLAPLVLAKFKVTFANTKKTRKLVICPPNKINIKRHDDSTVLDAWMAKRGFILNQTSEEDVADDVSVACS